VALFIRSFFGMHPDLHAAPVLRRIPRELEEAARIDGASVVQVI
jgi:ABC-type glycerol-3-phosphate transport system permease component